ncbi:DUF1361 domain-containing protein [Cohnella sp.]|uniref:DUF1361 domain-containing protein n=1 Tax=Cohnella sp. TaxID=1883426 RepID=UPI0035664279
MIKAGKPKITKPIIEPLFYMLTGTSVLCTLLIVVRASQVDYIQYRFLLWNLFLAWLPLLVSMFAIMIARIGKGTGKAIILTLCGVIWLLLYPNAPYLTTDFIHLILNPKYGMNHLDRLLLWYDLVMFFLFSWCGLLLGYLSMKDFHSLVWHYLNAWAGWVFIVIVSFLGGFGVYLGRVIRLNSWDVVFSPFRLIEGVLEGINAHAAIFTFLFGLLILIVYFSLYLLSGNGFSMAKNGSSAEN